MSLLSFYSYYRGTHGVIVVYDVTNGDSFVNVKRWLHEIDQNCDVVSRVLGESVDVKECIAILNDIQKLCFLCARVVGNKCDCPPERRVVVQEDARKFADQMSIQLFETSAKDNVNIEQVFSAITKLVLQQKKENGVKAGGEKSTIKLQKTPKDHKKCSC
jgi:Ras-related protein Rab-35